VTEWKRMKGKGKATQQQQQEKECPLQFPDLTVVNHEEECKRYTAGQHLILKRKADHC